MKRPAKRGRSGTPQEQLAGFIDKFDPAVGRLVRSCRAAVRKRLPTANELVYDNYNALAIGYAPTERLADIVVSLAVYPKWVSLFFLYGAKLADPQHVLQGEGKQVRFVRLDDVSVLDSPAVKALLAAALAQAKVPLPATGRGSTVIKSVSAKQRPRRPARK